MIDVTDASIDANPAECATQITLDIGADPIIVDLRDGVQPRKPLDTEALRARAIARLMRRNDDSLVPVVVLGEALLAEVKNLQARVFLDRGYIQPEALAHDRDVISIDLDHDPYQEHAQYFAVERYDGELRSVVAGARIIYSDAHRGHDSFPTLVNQHLDEGHVAQIRSRASSKFAEVSGLAKTPEAGNLAILKLYRTMLKFSAAAGHETWLMSVDPVVYESLRALVGPALEQIGEKAFFEGGYVIPAQIDVQQAVNYLSSESGGIAENDLRDQAQSFMKQDETVIAVDTGQVGRQLRLSFTIP